LDSYAAVIIGMALGALESFAREDRASRGVFLLGGNLVTTRIVIAAVLAHSTNSAT
jgi:hypothetical protein